MLANYAWSKELNGFAPVGAYYSSTNPFDRRFDYGLSDDDVAHAFKFSAVYQLPHIGAGGPAGKLVNGWGLSTIVRWQGGFPFTIFSGYDNSYSGVNRRSGRFRRGQYPAGEVELGPLSRRARPAVVQDLAVSIQFQPNAPGTFGNTGKNILRGPRTFATNLALVKDTKITEQANVMCSFAPRRSTFLITSTSTIRTIPRRTGSSDRSLSRATPEFCSLR